MTAPAPPVPALPAADLNDRLRLLVMGYIVSQAIFAAAELDIASRLTRGPRTARQLAADADADPGALERVLRALAAEGLFTEDEHGAFALTPLGDLLRSDAPGSLRHFSLQLAGEAYAAWGHSLHSVRTGRPSFERAFGTAYFDWLAGNPEAAARFSQLQAGLVTRRLTPLLEVPWRPGATVVDAGAGDGTLLIELLTAHPSLTGIAVDLPYVMAAAARRVEQAGLAGRVRCVAGDFFAGLPAGADYYVLAEILHDWDDGHAADILAQCRAAIPAHGRLLLLEQVIPAAPARHPSRLLDLHMLVMLGGRERTREQWRELLDQSGFRLEQITRAERSCLLEAVPCPPARTTIPQARPAHPTGRRT